MKYAVIGSNGGAGAAIIDELLTAKAEAVGITLSGRDKFGRDYPVIKANALELDELAAATVGSDIIFGAFNASEYSTKCWEVEFPKFMDNFIEVGKQTKAKLIFIDNLYSYADQKGASKYIESTEVNPPSSKGKIRARIAQQFLDAVQAGEIQGNIVRASDLYGPYSLNSLIGDRFFDGLFKKNSAEIIPLGKGKHSFTFTRDFAKTAVIVATSQRNGEVLHALNDTELSYEELIGKTLSIVGTHPTENRIPKFIFSLIQFFMPPVKSLLEMSYGFEHDFVVTSEKIQKLDQAYTPTRIDSGLKETVHWFKKQAKV